MRSVAAVVWMMFGCACVWSAEPGAEFKQARTDLQQGRYEEARRNFENLAKSSPKSERPAAVIGWSRALASVGESKQALRIVAEAGDAEPSPALLARLAELHFLRGDFSAARDAAENALRQDTDQLRARLILAHVDRETGELEKALEGYRWFVRYYNREQPKDAETLRLVAEGSLEYARWKRVSSVFHFVVNTLCPDALAADAGDWETLLLSGDLLLEKYNLPQARQELEAALKINPHAAGVHAALARAALQDHDEAQAATHAQQALEINPECVDALRSLAEIELDAGNLDAAEQHIRSALELRPTDQAALALQAALWTQKDGLPDVPELNGWLDPTVSPPDAVREGGPRLQQLLLDLTARNPAPGQFLNDFGMLLEARRKYDHAEMLYERALKVMPQLAAPRTNLGLLYMRSGRVEDAQRVLDEAFKADPFHVRVSNMRKVLGVLQGYESIRTEHFLVRVDASDKLLGEYMADYLEEVHDELSETYGYTPSEPTQFEVYTSAKGQTAHQWFSARMVGLPWIQTIGASTGRIVALASPSATDQPFHWGRVLRHEYVHILTLQQTDFNIPHWYTEALATREEGLDLIDDWKQLLQRRVPAGEVFTLKTINSGFQRPEGPDDWDMAYCQSRQYAQFLEDNFGAESLTKLLHAYRDGLTTEEAIPRATGISLEEFESRYLEHLQQLTAEIARSEADPAIDLDAAREAYEADQENPELAGRVAWALLKLKNAELARAAAEETLLAAPGEPWSTAVLAKLAITDEKLDEAEELLDGVDAEAPHAPTLALLAELRFNQQDYDAAIELFEAGVKQFPLEDAFWKGLTVALLARDAEGDDGRVCPLLAELAQRDAENIAVRRKLAQLALQRGDHREALAWAREVLFVDLEDADGHLLFGQALAGLERPDEAKREFERALEFDPDLCGPRVELARLAQSAGDRETALQHVRGALEINPDDAQAQQLLQQLQSPE